MPTRMVSVVVDAVDPAALARFYAAALGWSITEEDDSEVDVAPDGAVDGQPLVFVPVPEAKRGKNRVHLDLASRSAEDQAAQVARLRELGARPADVGQGEVPWVVLADPEGNVLCVLQPQDRYAGRTPASVVIDVADPARLAPFWAAATGLAVEEVTAEHARLRPTLPAAPYLELLRVPEPKLVKNRLHVDVAPHRHEDQAAEVARLRALGAVPVDVGQDAAGDAVTWVVLADPEGNELCVLSPR